MNDENVTFGDAVSVTIDGVRVEAHRGQTIAAVLIANGQRIFRHTRHAGRPRGIYCGMGVCYDCVVTVDGETERACMRKVEDGMSVTLRERFA